MVDSYFLSVKIIYIIVLIYHLVYILQEKLTKKSKTLSPNNSNPMHTCPPNSKLSIILTQRLTTKYKTIIKQQCFNNNCSLMSYFLLSGSFAFSFSKALISKRAASRYFSTFFIILTAAISSRLKNLQF